MLPHTRIKKSMIESIIRKKIIVTFPSMGGFHNTVLNVLYTSRQRDFLAASGSVSSRNSKNNNLVAVKMCSTRSPMFLDDGTSHEICTRSLLGNTRTWWKNPMNFQRRQCHLSASICSNPMLHSGYPFFPSSFWHSQIMLNTQTSTKHSEKNTATVRHSACASVRAF